MTVNVGLIGAGKGANGYGIGGYVAREVLNNTNCHLAAIMDLSLASAESAAAEINGRNDVRNKFKGRVYSVDEKKDFFIRDDLKLIIICSPAGTHYEYIQSSLQNGKHVLTEKPLLQCENVASREKKKRALELVSVASRSGLLLSTNCQRAGVVQVLNSKFKCSAKPNSVDIYLKIKSPDGRLESSDGLYDLLIAHPLSILVKYGVKDMSNMSINNHSIDETEVSKEIRVSGVCHFDERDMNINFIIGQCLDCSSTSFQMEINKKGLMDIQMITADSGELMTRYALKRDSNVQTEYSEDLLKSFIGSVVKSISLGTKPLIDNDETYLIYALQEDLRDRLKM